MPEFIRREKVWVAKGFGTRVVERGVIKCACGAEVLCEHFTNDCDRCGRLYNMSGQALLPRSQWEEPYFDGDYDEEALPGMTEDDYQMRQWEEDRYAEIDHP